MRKTSHEYFVNVYEKKILMREFFSFILMYNFIMLTLNVFITYIQRYWYKLRALRTALKENTGTSFENGGWVENMEEIMKLNVFLAIIKIENSSLNEKISLNKEMSN